MTTYNINDYSIDPLRNQNTILIGSNNEHTLLQEMSPTWMPILATNISSINGINGNNFSNIYYNNSRTIAFAVAMLILIKMILRITINNSNTDRCKHEYNLNVFSNINDQYNMNNIQQAHKALH